MKKLNTKQRLEFLDLLAKLSSPTTIERKLGLSKREQEAYRREFNVESQEEARLAWKKLKLAMEQEKEAFRVNETKKAREAEEIAQQRLDQLNQEKGAEKPLHTVDVNAIKREDAERQHRFEESQAKLLSKDGDWKLELEGSKESREAAIQLFRRDIVYRGFNFCKTKYGASRIQVQQEAERLKLDINWDLVRR